MNPGILGQLLPIILIIGVFYFIMIRPQQKKQKERREMLENLKKGDRIVTIGGIHGVIKEIDDSKISLQVADSVNIVFSRSAIGNVVTADEGA